MRRVNPKSNKKIQWRWWCIRGFEVAELRVR